MNKQYGVLLVGCGYIGEAHIKDIYFDQRVSLIATIDINEDLASLFARKYGAKYYDTNYKKYIDRNDVDIVIIATNTRSHFEILSEAIKNNKHVLCEKPMVARLEDLKPCVDMIKSANTKVLIGHILRHSKTYNLAHDMIKNGAIGNPKMFRMIQNHHAQNWERYKQLLYDCSPVVDCGVHYIDVAQWFADSKVKEIDGLATKIDDDCKNDNYNIINMKLENGVSAVFECCWSKNIISSNIKEFIGDKGYIKITLGCDRPCSHEKGDLIEYFNSENNTYEQINMGSSGKNMKGQFFYLIDMIEKNTPAKPTIDEVSDVLALAFYVENKICR